MTGRCQQLAQCAVVRQFSLVFFEFLPRNVGRKAVANQHPTPVVGVERATGGWPSWNLLARIDFTMSPTQCHGPIRQGILPRRRLPMFEHLLLGRLPHVHDRQPLEMPVAQQFPAMQKTRENGGCC